MSDAPEILELKQLLSAQPERASFKQALELRTKAGDLMLSAKDEETRFVLKAAYDKLTELLKARAKELGKENEFAEADRIANLGLETRQLLADLNAANAERFWTILNDPARQHEVKLLNSLIEVGGLPAVYLDRAKRSLKSTNRVLENYKARSPVRLRDKLMARLEAFRLKRKLRKE